MYTFGLAYNLVLCFLGVAISQYVSGAPSAEEAAEAMNAMLMASKQDKM